MLELTVNKDKFGLGYQSRQATHQKIPKTDKGQGLMLRETFVSVGHLFKGQISLVDDEASISDVECFVY